MSDERSSGEEEAPEKAMSQEDIINALGTLAIASLASANAIKELLLMVKDIPDIDKDRWVNISKTSETIYKAALEVGDRVYRQ